MIYSNNVDLFHRFDMELYKSYLDIHKQRSGSLVGIYR